LKSIIKNDKKIKIIRWIARIISTLFSAYFIFMAVGGAMTDSEEVSLVGVMVVVFAITLLIGVIIAWRNENLGGVILLSVGIAFAIFIYVTAGTHKLLASILISLPFYSSGILYLRIKQLRKKQI